MKALFCKIKKLPEIGDDLRICYSHIQRGGRSEACCTLNRTHFWRPVNGNEDLNGREMWKEQLEPNLPPAIWVKLTDDEAKEQIIATLASAISNSWTGELFACKARGDELVITSLDDGLKFFPMLNGRIEDGHDFIEIES